MRYVSGVFPGDYKIIPNGIDVDRFAGNPSPWPQYQDGKTNILFVGRLERRKGLKHLLEAYARIKLGQARHPSAGGRAGKTLTATPSKSSVRGRCRTWCSRGGSPTEDLTRYYAHR